MQGSDICAAEERPVTQESDIVPRELACDQESGAASRRSSPVPLERYCASAGNPDV